jgi:hypothetical protein
MHHAFSLGHCECGSLLEFRDASGAGSHREVACGCGRRHEVELGAGGWALVAQLTPERSVPLSGFSDELRHAPDAERYWFTFALRGEIPLPVHVLFSPSAQRAEVKAADLKVFPVSGVSRPTEARRRWIAWWQERQPAPRSRVAAFSAPRRVGRLPARLLGGPAAPAPVR